MPLIKHRNRLQAIGGNRLNSAMVVIGVAWLLLAALVFFDRASAPTLLADDTSPKRADGRSAGQTPASRFTADDFDRHVEQLKRKLPSDDFTVIVQPPFVVVGDESAQRVKARSVDTVKWAVDHLKARYFERDPEFIIDIWLFRDKESYEKNAAELFGEKPHTPYGYYSAQHRALVMNISTGGGTLVHEIVHPFVASNFPACPSWFNEGLASLYEQCGEERGQIKGFVNWRLNGLQDAIRASRLPAFETLCATTTDEFYHHDPGSNYGQARYLCYYLQEQGLLKKFYDDFRAGAKKDPSGYKTLQTVLNEKENGMTDFQKRWEAWVLELKRGG